MLYNHQLQRQHVWGTFHLCCDCGNHNNDHDHTRWRKNLLSQEMEKYVKELRKMGLSTHANELQAEIDFWR